MSAALKLVPETEPLSEKPRLGKKVTRPRLVWENPALTGETQKRKSKAKPDASYGRVLYNWFRYYDPQTGRYLTSDPTGLESSLNTYAYVDSNPLRWIDINGLIKLPGNPSGLPPEWQPDPSHQDPNGDRYRHPNGDYVDFHKGRPGERGWKGKDHWHHNGNKKHLNPGDEVPDSDDSSGSGESCGDNCQETVIAVGTGVGGAVLTYIIVKKCIGAGLLFTPAAPIGGGLLLTP